MHVIAHDVLSKIFSGEIVSRILCMLRHMMFAEFLWVCALPLCKICTKSSFKVSVSTFITQEVSLGPCIAPFVGFGISYVMYHYLV